MEHLQKNIQNVGRAFLRPELLPQQLKVLAVFLGRSQLYAASEERSLGCDAAEEHSQPAGRLPDWDGAIVVETKHDIFTLVNEHRLVLMGLSAIDEEECPTQEFQVPGPHSLG